MRPQQNAAEDGTAAGEDLTFQSSFNEAAAKCCGRHRQREQSLQLRDDASMRPQQNAAEDPVRLWAPDVGSGASMRPQQNAAEDIFFANRHGVGNVASMRPQQNAAEDQSTIATGTSLATLQ